uniref:Uncharacterized protein n=2 Tax=Oryza TaxID=4527 RepID=Q2QWF6_ORYSJ|nr:hypothetical protein LOC_Os12g09510 [Oryza sativa Japonica Group]
MCEMNHWKSYAFKLRERVVQILDPKKLFCGNDSHAENNHQWNGPILAKAMQECLSMFFLDWTDEVTNVDSGINSLVYMKNWMASNVSEVSIWYPLTISEQTL